MLEPFNLGTLSIRRCILRQQYERRIRKSKRVYLLASQEIHRIDISSAGNMRGGLGNGRRGILSCDEKIMASTYPRPATQNELFRI